MNLEVGIVPQQDHYRSTSRPQSVPAQGKRNYFVYINFLVTYRAQTLFSNIQGTNTLGGKIDYFLHINTTYADFDLGTLMVQIRLGYHFLDLPTIL